MATLLESGARPYGSSKGMVVSMLLHGGLIALAVFGTSQVVLPPREKVEEHPILYVAPPPPKPIAMAPQPLPKLKEPAPPKAKDNKVFRAPPPPKEQPRQAPKPTPAPVVPPKGPTTPALTAPVKVAVNIPPVDLKATPTISDVVAPPVSDKLKGGVSGEGSVKSSAGGEVDRGSKGGLGSGEADNRTYNENTVERAVQVTRAAAPHYPDALKSVGVEGTVVMRFIVGTDGRVEGGSFEVVSSPNNLFSEAVKNALRNTRYRAAEANGHSVRQLVEQSFTFRLDKSGD